LPKGWLDRLATYLRRLPVERAFRQSLKALPLKIIIGAGPQSQLGWVATDISRLNLLKPERWGRYLQPCSVDALMAEHVWEHLSKEEAVSAAKTCFKYLKVGGYLRIAVPDGLQISAEYIESVRPGGSGPGAEDHKVLYDYRSLTAMLRQAGFTVQSLEYFDEAGQFHAQPWDDEDGRISRSSRHDVRNVDGRLKYTSLIVDAIKPKAPQT